MIQQLVKEFPKNIFTIESVFAVTYVGTMQDVERFDKYVVADDPTDDIKRWNDD